MKTLILKNNVPLGSPLGAGIDIVKDSLSSIRFPFTITEDTTDLLFTGVIGKNAENQDITFIPQGQIEPLKGSNNALVLVYDADKVLPRPTNPVALGNLIQIPTQWFNTPRGFAEYFLHEICHSLFARSGLKDMTHLINHRDWDPAMYDRFNIGSNPIPYYLYLITSLKQWWDVSVSQSTVLKYGSKGPLVKELQTLLGIKADGDFGPITKRIVVAYQISKKLVGDGIVGDKTWASLRNTQKLSLVDAIIQVESNGNLFAIGDTTLVDKAYGCMQIRKGVCTDVNKKYGTNYKPQDMLGNRELSIDMFNKYFTIYTQNDTDEEKARAWNGGGNYQKIYNKKGYERYGKQLDVYWEKVKKLLTTK